MNPNAAPGAQPKLSISEPVLGRASLPVEPSQVTYDLAKTTLGVGRTLMDVLNAHQLYTLYEGEVVHRSVTFDKPELLTPKDDYFFKAGPVVGLEWEIVGRMARLLRGTSASTRARSSARSSIPTQ